MYLEPRPFPLVILELIDTLWNVNEDWIELIDTLWNVNVKKVDTDEWEYQELIDTLWNVNTHLKLI